MRRNRSLCVPTTLAAALGAISLVSVTEASTATDSGRGTLAFVAAEDDYHDAPTDIYVAGLDGGQRNLTKTKAMNEYYPAWSPDGRQIAFETTDGYASPGQIFVMGADGSARHRLTRAVRARDYSSFGAWSPNGRRIVYTRSVGGNLDAYEIYVMNSNGSGKRRLTRNKVDDYGPFWSPDGRLIVFTRQSRSGNADLYTVSSSGGVPRRLTRTGDSVAEGWAPGRQIIFTRSSIGADAGPASGIYLIEATGTGLRRLTHHRPGDSFDVAGWSPNGSLVLYYGEGIQIVNASNGRNERLTPSDQDWYATWSPDGQEIAFVRGKAIWVINREGSSIRQVTQPQGLEIHYSPNWSR